jgi:hypothetical protein
MSDQTAPPQPIGRVVVELSADGRIYMERYVNGARTRTLLDRGNEWWEVLDALAEQRRASEASAALRAEQAERASRLRHNRVWVTTAETHGAGFAHRVIKGEVPPGYGRYLAPEVQPKPRAKEQPTLKQMLDLL